MHLSSVCVQPRGPFVCCCQWKCDQHLLHYHIWGCSESEGTQWKSTCSKFKGKVQNWKLCHLCSNAMCMYFVAYDIFNVEMKCLPEQSLNSVYVNVLQVRAIAFSTEDSRLVSCGMDGAVYEWNTLTGARESESVLKTCSYTGVTISPDSKTFFAVGTDCSLKEIQDCQVITFSKDSFAFTFWVTELDSDW